MELFFFSFILVFLFCMSICGVLRECITFMRCYVKTEEYTLSNPRMVTLWATISYIITFIIVYL